MENRTLDTIAKMRLEGNLLFLYRPRIEGVPSIFHILNLPGLFNNVSNQKCIIIADAYFGKNKLFIYKVKENRILERWLITPDGHQINSTIVAETKYVCFSLFTLIIVMLSQSKMFVPMQDKLK